MGVMANVLAILGVVGLSTAIALARDVGAFFAQSPFAMSGLCLFAVALGYWMNSLVRLVMNSRANEEKAFVKRLHSALKEKGCADYYDIYCKESVDALAERMAEIARNDSRRLDRGVDAESADDDWRMEAFGRILAEPTELSPTAERLLREMTDDEARCFRYLANVAVLRGGRPSEPLVVTPTDGAYETMGVTDELIGSLVAHGLLERRDIRRVIRETDYRKVENRKADEPVGTRSSSGVLAPIFVHGTGLVYPNPPLRFTVDGSEIAAICGTEQYPDAVANFNRLWKERFDQYRITWK